VTVFSRAYGLEWRACNFLRHAFGLPWHWEMYLRPLSCLESSGQSESAHFCSTARVVVVSYCKGFCGPSQDSKLPTLPFRMDHNGSGWVANAERAPFWSLTMSSPLPLKSQTAATANRYSNLLRATAGTTVSGGIDGGYFGSFRRPLAGTSESCHNVTNKGGGTCLFLITTSALN
jgi:hypothetical protein